MCKKRKEVQLLNLQTFYYCYHWPDLDRYTPLVLKLLRSSLTSLAQIHTSTLAGISFWKLCTPPQLLVGIDFVKSYCLLTSLWKLCPTPASTLSLGNRLWKSYFGGNIPGNLCIWPHWDPHTLLAPRNLIPTAFGGGTSPGNNLYIWPHWDLTLSLWILCIGSTPLEPLLNPTLVLPETLTSLVNSYLLPWPGIIAFGFPPWHQTYTITYCLCPRTYERALPYPYDRNLLPFTSPFFHIRS